MRSKWLKRFYWLKYGVKKLCLSDFKSIRYRKDSCVVVISETFKRWKNLSLKLLRNNYGFRTSCQRHFKVKWYHHEEDWRSDSRYRQEYTFFIPSYESQSKMADWCWYPNIDVTVGSTWRARVANGSKVVERWNHSAKGFCGCWEWTDSHFPPITRCTFLITYTTLAFTSAILIRESHQSVSFYASDVCWLFDPDPSI